MSTAWFSSTVVFITYDESLKTHHSGFGTLHGGHVYFVAVSPFTKGTATYSLSAGHHNLMTTVEWLFGLGSTGHNDSPLVYPPMKTLFTFGGTHSAGHLGLVIARDDGSASLLRVLLLPSPSCPE